MDWKEYCEERKPIVDKIKRLKKDLEDLEFLYVCEHRQYMRGDHVIIHSQKMKLHAVVVGNKVVKNGRVVPTLVLMAKNMLKKKRYYHLHENDESIVIEKCND